MSFFSNSKPLSVKRRKKVRQDLAWQKDASIQKEMEEIVKALDMEHVKAERVFCYKTTGSKARAYARIWAFPKIFQQVLNIEPAYVMEVISERFERLDSDSRKKVIIHELLHIPKNFSGALLPHKYGYTKIEKEVSVLFDRYKQNRK